MPRSRSGPGQGTVQGAIKRTRTMFADNIFLSMALVLGLAVILGFVGQKLRQPLIIMFLATGVLAGPGGLGIMDSNSDVTLLAQIGIALLLFIVGLKLDLSLIKSIGPVALTTGIAQIILTGVIGFMLDVVLGMSLVEAIYVSLALTFSSTIIVVKLLSDKKEIDSLHGQIALGLLIVQDLVAIVSLVALTTLGADLSVGTSPLLTYLGMAGKGVGFLIFAALFGRYVIPWLTSQLARSQELLVLFSIAWAIILGALSEYIGFTMEVGAFIAGVTLASTHYRDAIGAKLTTLRDFLLLFFFIGLGAHLYWAEMGTWVFTAIVLSLFVLLGKPIIVMAVMGLMGYRRRTGFLAGLSIAQISEFSLVIGVLGLGLGHISEKTMGVITLVGIITILSSSYMILYSDRIYRLLEGPLRVFEKRETFREMEIGTEDLPARTDVIIMGVGQYGSNMAEGLIRRGKKILAVDYDPVALRVWARKGEAVLYGDMADMEIMDHLPLKRADWVVSTVRVRDHNLALLQNLKLRGFKGKVALTAVSKEEARLYERNGANLVFRPFNDASELASDTLVGMMETLPQDHNCGISFKDVNFRSWPGPSGYKLRDLPLRSATGVSILAIKRGGRIINDPGPEFRIFPGDKLVIAGLPDKLELAERVLDELEGIADQDVKERYKMAEMKVSDDPRIAGRSLANVKFKQEHGLTVLGIRHGNGDVTAPDPNYNLSKDDVLIVIGPPKAVSKFKWIEMVCNSPMDPRSSPPGTAP
jgi:predicted Kef-type K+ transport protein/Trk K+ transport system NAD-binding subunit